MRDEKCEYFVIYEKQHFEPISRFKYSCKKSCEFRKIDKLTIRLAVDIKDFDIEIKK